MTRYVKVIDGPGTSVTYIDENGYHVIYSSGARAWRNNNPGNLREGVVSKRNAQITNVYGDKDLAGLIENMLLAPRIIPKNI